MELLLLILRNLDTKQWSQIKMKKILFIFKTAFIILLFNSYSFAGVSTPTPTTALNKIASSMSHSAINNAQTVANRGMDAILALMGRGVGEATCQRLMRKVQRGDKEALLEAIHIAEIEYARTRRFWG